MDFSVTNFSQQNNQYPQHQNDAAGHSYAPKNNLTKFIAASEISERIGFSVEDIVAMAKSQELPSRFDKTKGIWLFHPKAAELFCKKMEQNFLTLPSAPVTEVGSTEKSKGNEVTKKVENKKENTSAINEDIKTEKIDYLELTSQRVEKYCKLNKREKSMINKKHSEMLLETNSTKTLIFDYINYFKLSIGENRGKFNLNLRRQGNINKKIATIFGQKRVSLSSKNKEDALIEANKLIAQKCIETDTTLLPEQNESMLLAPVLKSSAIKNKGNKSELDMLSKLAFWHYVAGDVPITEISYALLSEIEDVMLIQDVEKSTINGYNTEIRKALKLASNKGFIQGVPEINSHKSNERELIELPFQEAWMPFVKTYSTSIPERKFLELSWHKGLRKHNILYVEYDHFIQLENGKWIMRLPKKQNKSGKAIDIAVNNAEMKIINFMKRFHEKKGIESKYVFALNSSDDVPNIDTTRWRSALKECNLPDNLVFHHLRHYFATRLRLKGIELDTIRRLGGWLCLDSLKRYIHCGVTDKDHEAIEDDLPKKPETTAKNNITIHNAEGVVNIS